MLHLLFTTHAVAAVSALALGAVAGYMFFRYVLKKKYHRMIEAANSEAEVLKEKKLLEVKETFINKRAELAKEVQQRKQKILLTENKLKQRELTLNQRQDELGKRQSELDSTRNKLDNRANALNKKRKRWKPFCSRSARNWKN